MRSRWAILILLLAGIVSYANTAGNGLFWDDDEFITRNAYIRSFQFIPQWFTTPITAGAGVNSNYYRPLLTASFSLDYHLWGLWPAGYHLENMLWHTFAGVLLFVFLSIFISVVSSEVERPSVSDKNINIASLDSSTRRQLLARNDVSRARMIAFAASLLWLIHPIHTEAVAYANSRGDSMATAFILLSLILWLKNRFFGSAIAFIAALLSKEFAIVTPGLILLVKSLREAPMAMGTTCLAGRQAWQSGSLSCRAGSRSAGRNFQSYIDDRRSSLIYITNLASKKLYRLLTIVGNLYNFIKPILPHITIAVIYLILRLTVLNFQNTLNFYGTSLIRSDLCSTQRSAPCPPIELYATSLKVRMLTFLKVLPIYAGILVWPTDLHMERTVDIPTTILDPSILLSLSFILILAGFFGWTPANIRKLWRAGTSEPRNRALVTHGRRPWEQVSVVWGALGWFFISILPVSGLIPISQILAEHFLYLPSIGFFLIIAWLLASIIRQRILFFIVLCLLFTVLSFKTISQNRIWYDPITFYEYTLSKTTPTARVYNNLAMAYADARDYQKAITNYNNAISLGDAYPNPHYNLGNTFLGMGNVEEAEKEYKRALEIDPNFHFATLKLGQLYLDQGKTEEAVKFVCPAFPEQPLCRQGSRP